MKGLNDIYSRFKRLTPRLVTDKLVTVWLVQKFFVSLP
jgi:hypothetical protein